MSKGAAVAPGFGNDADGICCPNPLLRGQRKRVGTGSVSKHLEFEGVKSGIIQLLPQTKKLNDILVAQPVLNRCGWVR